MKPIKPTQVHGWTPERRQRQAELIKSWRPWAKSTGPKTEAGKAKAAKNSFKHGVRSEGWRILSRILRQA